jgi:hypothetical protein
MYNKYETEVMVTHVDSDDEFASHSNHTKGVCAQKLLKYLFENTKGRGIFIKTKKIRKKIRKNLKNPIFSMYYGT